MATFLHPLHSLHKAALALACALALALSWGGASGAQVSIGVALPGVSIGINLPAYPQFVRVPNYPVYYAPALQSNYFFYDGRYWVFQADDWYSSAWYDGPWYAVPSHAVPLYVLRIPVRYYRDPPPYFRGWQAAAPPRWGEHWGDDWSRQRRGWDRWDRRNAPAPAPLPAYQRQYSGERYPQAEQQRDLQGRHYRYQPRDGSVRQHEPQYGPPRAALPPPRQAPPPREVRDVRAGPPASHQPPGHGRDDNPGRAKGHDKDKDKDKDKDRGRGQGRDDGSDAGKERKK